MHPAFSSTVQGLKKCEENRVSDCCDSSWEISRPEVNIYGEYLNIK